jgi:hypothetical protein
MGHGADALRFGQHLPDGDFAGGQPMREDIENLAGVGLDD